MTRPLALLLVLSAATAHAESVIATVRLVDEAVDAFDAGLNP